jgi:hypothetical protein
MDIFEAVAIGSCLVLAHASYALAQVQSGVHADRSRRQDQAVNSSDAAGQNSFSKTQAWARIRRAGFSSVNDLVLDRNGVWQGQAIRDGRTVQVALDHKGEVASQ